MKKVLLTGATGFVGKNIYPILSERYDIIAPKRDELNILDLSEVRDYLASYKFDVVI
ncbi:MAG: sugar nucleotide-binding protein, partial [Lachnospiraceae bacterium]|nr:sugar nucleotide-binding protein [Lachnospiraceae bacterium]